MPRVTCRCGEKMSVPADGPERVDCPKCGAKIRVRRSEPRGDPDGFIRFPCPCTRRLKVRAVSTSTPQAVKCPDCGRIVPVPTRAEAVAAGASTGLDTDTQELSKDDLAKLEAWSRERLAQTGAVPAPPGASAVAAPAAPVKMEAGLRVCPKCRRPVHLNATTCRECGAAVPRK